MRGLISIALAVMAQLAVVLAALLAVVASVPPPAFAASGEVSFFVWGHPRGNANGDPPLHFDEVLALLSEHRPDALIVTGDAIVGGDVHSNSEPEWADAVRGDWTRLHEAVAALGVDLHVSPGNHDINDPFTRDVFLEFHRKPPYAFTLGRTRMVVLDSVGIDEQTRSAREVFLRGAVPFDEAQLELIRREAESSAQYDHVFFFMHHVNPWRSRDGFWWRDVHPLLVGTNTRVVFSGTPRDLKYAHLERDGIHYVLSCTLPPLPPASLRYAPPNDWSLHHQPDTLQRVVVSGDQYDVETHVLGTWTSPGLDPGYWDEVVASRDGSARAVLWLRSQFADRRSTARALIALGGVGFLVGGLVVAAALRITRARSPRLR